MDFTEIAQGIVRDNETGLHFVSLAKVGAALQATGMPTGHVTAIQEGLLTEALDAELNIVEPAPRELIPLIENEERRVDFDFKEGRGRQ